MEAAASNEKYEKKDEYFVFEWIRGHWNAWRGGDAAVNAISA